MCKVRDSISVVCCVVLCFVTYLILLSLPDSGG